MPRSNVIALDVGEVRVGVAYARADITVPVRLTTLNRKDENFWQQITEVIADHQAESIIIGLPRGLDGQETDQTISAKEFATELAQHTDLTIIWQDEALTSVKAKAVLNESGKPYQKSDIDALAASFILSDYLETGLS